MSHLQQPTVHEPRRDDAVAEWIRRHRDRMVNMKGDRLNEWYHFDALLDEYREHADTGTPLDREVQGPHPEADGPEVWEEPQPPTRVLAVRNRAGLWVRGQRHTYIESRRVWFNDDYPHTTPTWAQLLADGPLTDATHELEEQDPTLYWTTEDGR